MQSGKLYIHLASFRCYSDFTQRFNPPADFKQTQTIKEKHCEKILILKLFSFDALMLIAIRYPSSAIRSQLPELTSVSNYICMLPLEKQTFHRLFGDQAKILQVNLNYGVGPFEQWDLVWAFFAITFNIIDVLINSTYT